MLAPVGSDVSDVSGAGEEIPVLVERNGHDPVRRVERLLDAITVVDVYIDVKHPAVESARGILGEIGGRNR